MPPRCDRQVGASTARLILGNIVFPMYHCLGLRHDREIHGATNRPFRIVPTGDVVDALMA